MVSDEELLRQANRTIFEFYRLMRRLSRRLEKSRDKVASAYNVSGAELYVFWNVYTLQKCTYSELAEHSGLANNTISVLAKSLLKQGYVQQHPDPNDGRKTRLTATELGKELVETILNSLVGSPLSSNILTLGNALSSPISKPQNVFEILSKL